MDSTRGAWSEPIDDMRARLRIELEDLGAGVRLAVNLELLNCSSRPRAVTNRPDVSAAIFDSAGSSLQPAGVAASAPILPAQWAVIPQDAYIGFRVDHPGLGVPVKAQRMTLVAVGAGSWNLAIGTYTLNMTVRYEHAAEGPENQWVGELTLPAVEFEVTDPSLAGS